MRTTDFDCLMKKDGSSTRLLDRDDVRLRKVTSRQAESGNVLESCPNGMHGDVTGKSMWNDGLVQLSVSKLYLPNRPILFGAQSIVSLVSAGSKENEKSMSDAASCVSRRFVNRGRALPIYESVQ